MAFVPSSKDFESNEQGFVPTSEHFENNENPQSTSESILNYLKNIPNAARKEMQNDPQFVSQGHLNEPSINEFIEKSLGGLGFEGPALAGIAKRGAISLGEKLAPSIAKYTGKKEAQEAENLYNEALKNYSKESEALPISHE